MGTIIRNMPILDLRTTPAEAIPNIELVENVRTVVLSTANAEAFMSVPRVEVRSHLIVEPEETLLIGQIELGDGLLNQLPENTRLVVLGHAYVEGFTLPLFLQKIKGFRMYGQVIYSDARSVGALLARMERLQGQVLRTRPGAVRWVGSTYLDTNLLASVSGRSVVSIGPITIDPLVNASEITEHIDSMVQIGEISGREETISALLSVCNQRLGSYTLSEA